MSRPSRFPHNGLVDLRKRAGLTQMCTAVRCGVSQIVFYLWETSRRPIPAARLATVARVLGCSEAEVLAAVRIDTEPEHRPTEAIPPRFIDPACPTGWLYQDEDSRDGQARFEAWMAEEADRIVVAAQIRYRTRPVKFGRVG